MRNDDGTHLHKNMIEAHGALLNTVHVAFVSVEASAFIEDGLNHQLHPGIRKVICEEVMKTSNSL